MVYLSIYTYIEIERKLNEGDIEFKRQKIEMSRIATAYKQHLVQCLHVSNFHACEFEYTANHE